MNIRRFETIITAVVLAACLLSRGGGSPPFPGIAVSGTTWERQPLSYADYAAVLEKFVNNEGMVDYKGLRAQRQRLDKFTSAVGQLQKTAYDRWSRKDRIAFWINTYNALTLEAILNHYPIKPSLFKSLRFPKNSIRQIEGVWDKLQFPVIGRKVTLDGIEHQVLRKEFNEPRIHMALVCAAMSCPPLRNEPFHGDQLEDQLDAQTRQFLSSPRGVRMERTKKRVSLSSIFQWYGDDFIKTYGTDPRFTWRSPREGAVLNFISRYLGTADLEYLEAGKYDIHYLEYDWSLNEQGRR